MQYLVTAEWVELGALLSAEQVKRDNRSNGRP
jgi:hypothetical protein